ncbi:MAG: hypothetical protein RLY31_1840 [Bacteroidota bacterium]|jgi:predicted CoA-binding protein
MKKTLVIGASNQPDRYANMAIRFLREKGVETIAIGSRPGTVGDVEIRTDLPSLAGTDTVTIYLRPDRQQAFHDYLLTIRPRRVIFNPGTENPALANILSSEGIEVLEACTLVLLSTGQY